MKSEIFTEGNEGNEELKTKTDLNFTGANRGNREEQQFLLAAKRVCNVYEQIQSDAGREPRSLWLAKPKNAESLTRLVVELNYLLAWREELKGNEGDEGNEGKAKL